VLLSVGLNTPSLRLRESNATPHSTKFNIDRDIPFLLRAYPLQTHEMLFDAHWHGFRVFGGVPGRGIYDIEP
jgi:hypothetical protein